MQRFMRDPRGNMSEASLAGAYGEPIELIRKHFAPGVAAAYAMPRLGADGVLEWWTSQQGAVTPYAALSADAQHALLRAYEAHVATLGGLAEAMRARGMNDQALRIEALRTPPDPDKLYSVDGRLLMRLHEAPPAQPAVAEPPVKSAAPWRWLAAGALLVLAMLLAAAWWWMGQAPAPVVAAVPAPKPPPEEEPVRDPEWPAELVLVLETASRMQAAPTKTGGPARLVIGRHEIRGIVDRLPAVTNTQLVTFPALQCGTPLRQGVFQAENRAKLLEAVKSTQGAGKAALSEGLRTAAASVDGVKRDALVFMFLGGPDECGQDICAVAAQLVEEKPRLRINVLDLSGTKSVNACLGGLPRVARYHWGLLPPDKTGVDLSHEASKMLVPAADSGTTPQGASPPK